MHPQKQHRTYRRGGNKAVAERAQEGPASALSQDRQITWLPLWGPQLPKPALNNAGKIGHGRNS